MALAFALAIAVAPAAEATSDHPSGSAPAPSVSPSPASAAIASPAASVASAPSPVPGASPDGAAVAALPGASATAPRLTLVLFQKDVVLVGGRNFPVGAAVRLVAVGDGLGAETSATADADGRVVVGFLVPGGYSGPVTVTATASAPSNGASPASATPPTPTPSPASTATPALPTPTTTTPAGPTPPGPTPASTAAASTAVSEGGGLLTASATLSVTVPTGAAQGAVVSTPPGATPPASPSPGGSAAGTARPPAASPAPSASPATVASGAGSSAAVPPAGPTPSGPPAGAGWRLVFGDDFTGTDLDRTRWQLCNPSFRALCLPWNDEKQVFNTAATNNPNVTVADGALHLTATRDADGQIRSGMVSTGPWPASFGTPPAGYRGFSYTYGYYEGRVRIPRGNGFWPSMWELPVSSGQGAAGWPDTGEMDVFEIPGNNPTEYHFTAHWGGGGGACGHPCSPQQATISDASADWHVFGLDWEPDGLTWYVDGQKMGRTVTDPGAVKNTPFFVIANLSVGGTWKPLGAGVDASTPFPASMDIDYLRVYQRS
ncbi:Glycoside hydrolase family 16 (modular protein) [Frankia canadensis]|uniref:Glycoside hydrolase family 16 (Modular protein) n=1 Tax=Frankia canadensis TaxID=1836972 RepID=A0A2I2KVB0_9ACTN|nr:Glycoside hydrolase family 16 (modular protein) [Frankia canadensis]SOU56892.1 Glycoside hydrolase family 16 (modular protein) [Frankia canadensis]